jgi:hypothetical protein
MMKFTRLLCFGLLTMTVAGLAGPLPAVAAPQAKERFEVTAIKAVRPTLVRTVDALKKKDVAGARAAFEDYDVMWNGIEVYINTRDRAMYGELEQNLQAKITKGLAAPMPDTDSLLADGTTMLGKYDEAIAMVQKASPLSPLFDDVARLRTVRSPMRLVTPALQTGDFSKARKMYSAFDDKWDSIEDLIKARSADAYTDIEKDMIQIEKALIPDKPDVDATIVIVKDLTDKYNAVVADITKDARATVAAK